MISAPLQVSAPKGALGFRFGASSCTTASSRSTIRCAAAPAAAAGRRASTLYEELGLRAGATGREIKAAYRRLARERHPDVAGATAAGDDFVRLHDAYATLSDPDSRARYDRGAMATAMAVAAGVARYDTRRAGGSGRPRRTWETDQCW